MARDRDVAAFGERARSYDEGRLGQLHHQIADRTADLALACVPAPRRILDDCTQRNGTGSTPSSSRQRRLPNNP
jgi:hypothetical protein